MSELRVDNIVSEDGTSAPIYSQGMNIGAGKTLAVTGNVEVSGTFKANTLTPLTGDDVVISGAGVSIGAGQTLTNEGDYTVGGATSITGTVELHNTGTISIGGGVNVTGVTTFGVVDVTASGFNLAGMSTFKGADFDGGSELKEKCNITAGKLSDNTNIDLEDGMIHLFTTQETTTSTPNIRVSGSKSLNSAMGTGDTIAVTIITTAAAGGFSAQLTIDGGSITENWLGGSAPSAGGSDGFDVYSYQIIKTGDAAYTVICSVQNFT